MVALLIEGRDPELRNLPRGLPLLLMVQVLSLRRIQLHVDMYKEHPDNLLEAGGSTTRVLVRFTVVRGQLGLVAGEDRPLLCGDALLGLAAEPRTEVDDIPLLQDW